MKQTFIIKTSGGGREDFHRVGCKRVETALKYLKGWRLQAIGKGWDKLFTDLTASDASYKIIATPDGYNLGEVVASGFTADL